MLDILTTLDERVNAMAERIQSPQSDGHSASGHQTHGPAGGPFHGEVNSSVSEISRRQRQLDRKPERTRPGNSSPRSHLADYENSPASSSAAFPDSTPSAHTMPSARSMDAHFSDLADRIETLRNQPDTGPIIDLRNEVNALRSDFANQLRGQGQDQHDDFAQIQSIVRNLEASIRNNPGHANVENVRMEIADLRAIVLSNNTNAEVAFLRDGHENILARLEGLQSTVDGPQLSHSIVDRLSESRPGQANIEDVRMEIADLRETVLSTNTNAEVASLRDGYENILARLEGLQSTVGDPKLYHSIADRLSEVRKALRAIPQVEHASGLERRVSALADQLETVGAQVDNLPFDTLQNQVFEVQEALQTFNPSVAFKDLDWKLHGLSDKMDTLEEGLAGSNAVSNRVASLEDLIRSQPSAADVTDRLDALHELFLEKNGHDAAKDLEHRIAKIGDKLDFIGANSNPNDTLAALDGRVGDLCARFDTFSTSFDTFAGSQNNESMNPQIEMIAARIESLAETLVDGKSIEPIRSDISELRKDLADGDRAVVDLAERIGRIGDRLDRFTVFDGEDGKLGHLSVDLMQLQKQIADGDTVVFEILKRVGSLERTLNQAVEDTGSDSGDVAAEIAEIRDRLASGDATLTNIANRMESLLTSVNVVANEPGLLSELEPVQNDFAALQSELTEGNKVARNVLGGLSAIDEKLNTLTVERAENADISRLSDEIATLRTVVQATDNAAVLSLKEQISNLAEQLDRAPAHQTDDTMFHNLEQQFAQMSAKLATTEQQLGHLSSVADKLDRIDEMLLESRRETVSATRQVLDEFAGTNAQGPINGEQLDQLASVAQKLDRIDDMLLENRHETLSATRKALDEFASSAAQRSTVDDPTVLALQSDLKRLQSSASKTDESFGAVQYALTGIADRLSSLETSGPAQQDIPVQGRAHSQPPAGHPSTNSIQGNPAPSDERLESASVEPTIVGAPPPAPEDNRPLEPGSGKPRVGRNARDQSPPQKSPAAKPRPGAPAGKERSKPAVDRAVFLAAARKAAKQTEAETGAKSISGESKPKQNWLAKAVSLSKRKGPKSKSTPESDMGMDVDATTGRREPKMSTKPERSNRVSVLEDEVSEAPSVTPRQGSAIRDSSLNALGEKGPKSIFKKHARSILAAVLAIAVVIGGLQVFKIYFADGLNLASLTGSVPSTTNSEMVAGAPNEAQGDTSDPAGIVASTSDGSTSSTDLAFSPPSGLESTFDQPANGQASGALSQPIAEPRQIPVGEASTTPEGTQTLSVPNSGSSQEPAQVATAPANQITRQNLPDADVGPLALRKAAADGNIFAQFEIASRYMEGRSVSQNLPKAVEWYSKAAGKGFAQAQYRLGSMFEKGLGIPKDLQSARSWYTRAADKGNAKAIHNLAVLHAEGGLGERNFNRAAQWFIQSANYGVTDSQYNLGILYAQGLGVERSKSESYKWFSLAAKAGDADAGRKRDAVANELDEEQKSRARIAVSAWKPESLNPTANTLPAIPAEWQGAKPKPASNKRTLAIKQVRTLRQSKLLALKQS